MPAQLVISRGTERADSTQGDTTWARQWAKQSRRLQKRLAYRTLTYKSIELTAACSRDRLSCENATSSAPGFGRRVFLEWAGRITNQRWTTITAMPTSTLVCIQGYLQRSIATKIHRVNTTRKKEFRRKLFGDTQQGFALHRKLTKPEQAPPVTQVTYEEKATLQDKTEEKMWIQCPATILPGIVLKHKTKGTKQVKKVNTTPMKSTAAT